MAARPVTSRARWAVALVLALAFSQVALAAYACVSFAQGAAGSHAECVAAHERHGARCDASLLCWTHCQQIDQGVDRADAPHLAWAVAPAAPMLASLLEPAPGGVLVAVASTRAPPPVQILYCRLRN